MGWSKCLEYVCLIGMHIGWIFVLVRKLQREVFLYEAQPVWLRDNMHFV